MSQKGRRFKMRLLSEDSKSHFAYFASRSRKIKCAQTVRAVLIFWAPTARSRSKRHRRFAVIKKKVAKKVAEPLAVPPNQSLSDVNHNMQNAKYWRYARRPRPRGEGA